MIPNERNQQFELNYFTAQKYEILGFGGHPILNVHLVTTDNFLMVMAQNSICVLAFFTEEVLRVWVDLLTSFGA